MFVLKKFAEGVQRYFPKTDRDIWRDKRIAYLERKSAEDELRIGAYRKESNENRVRYLKEIGNSKESGAITKETEKQIDWIKEKSKNMDEFESLADDGKTYFGKLVDSEFVKNVLAAQAIAMAGYEWTKYGREIAGKMTPEQMILLLEQNKSRYVTFELENQEAAHYETYLIEEDKIKFIGEMPYWDKNIYSLDLKPSRNDKK